MKALETGRNESLTAILHTESITGLRVTVHDLTHSLWQTLPAERFRHAHPACHEVKTGPRGAECLAFEIAGFRKIAGSVRNGRVHRCHAGFCEAVYPVFHDAALALVLFLGPFLPENPGSRQQPGGPSLPRRSDSEAATALEALRQLGSRLRCLIIDTPERLSVQDVSRATRIRQFMAARYAEAIQLSDLAEELSLSVDRTRHVVREQCGTPFRDLLEETRLQAARALLLNSRLTIGEISDRCGFADRTSFSRAFRRACVVSPRQWRREHQS
ncbi:MAG: AraC family transcriptional regulator [Spirochaetaceae bacterium]|nr:MAG: AraC family transcriptional regulator [Spirochaetaceae bacterium]